MPELSIPRAHSNGWYDQLALQQEGYYYPWHSTIAGGNGEDAFLNLVHQQITPASSLLEIGCGHGELANSLADRCSHITAYDRVASYIEIAQARCNQRNVDYLCADAETPEGIQLPIADQSVDMIIGRRAPLHWIEDAVRVCKPGAILIGLCPMEEPIPAWSSKLPTKMHYENSGRHTGHGSIHQSVENRLHRAGLVLHSGWSFDVPETFATPDELYRMLSWGLPVDEIPSFEDLEQRLGLVFEQFAEAEGIVLRHCRYLWMARIPG